jgi:hypothetical protein
MNPLDFLLVAERTLDVREVAIIIFRYTHICSITVSKLVQSSIQASIRSHAALHQAHPRPVCWPEWQERHLCVSTG